jgi:uncharacterized small protein (DUF1192 family)
MTTMEHSVAPEDVMALLDGELPVAEAQAVSAHLEQCAQCAMLAEELRGTSRLLSRWSVPDVPTELQDAVMSAAAKAPVGRAIVKRSGWFPGGLRNWKLLVSGGAAAVALLALVVFSPTNRNQSSQSGPVGMLRTVDGSLQAQRFKDKRPVAEPLSDRVYDRAAKSIAGVAGMSGGPMGGMLPTPAPMIARTVALTIVVKDVDAARTSLDSILAQHRGYSAQLNTMRPEDGPRSLQSSLRIPAEELQSTVAAIKMLGRVETESQSGEEVSQQHADLVARLKTARETEERFRDILQQRTGKVSDVLEVEQSIARVRGEIERMEAEQKALEHRVDFASVEVQLSEEYKAQFDSPAASVSTRIHNAFVAGYQNATESLLGFVLFVEEYGPSLLLWMAILGLPVVLAWRRYKRIRSSI